eukprot:gene3219-6364_t
MNSMNPFKATEKRFKAMGNQLSCDEDDDIIDLRSANGLPNGVDKCSVTIWNKPTNMFSLSRHPGLFILCDAIPANMQLDLCLKSLRDYASEPNTTNTPECCGCWTKESPMLDDYHKEQDLCPRLPKSWTLSRLRWATLGFQYDWTNRIYNREIHIPFPDDLAAMCKDLAAAAGYTMRPEAAIVNFYPEGSTMGGHRDEVEPCQDAPIVSLSLGCPAVFLIGDVVVMGGMSRLAVHGVPRVFIGGRGEMAPPSYLHPSTTTTAIDDINSPLLASFVSKESDAEVSVSGERWRWRVLRYLQTARININVRQVYE